MHNFLYMGMITPYFLHMQYFINKFTFIAPFHFKLGLSEFRVYQFLNSVRYSWVTLKTRHCSTADGEHTWNFELIESTPYIHPRVSYEVPAVSISKIIGHQGPLLLK